MEDVHSPVPEVSGSDPRDVRGSVSIAEVYVDRKQLASIMGVSVATVDRMVRAGMPSETWGLRSRRFRPSLALRWAQDQGASR